MRSKEKLVAIFLSETIPSLFKWSGLVLMVYFGSIAIRSLSGKTTVSNIVFKFIEQADSLKAETFGYSDFVIDFHFLISHRQIISI